MNRNQFLGHKRSIAILVFLLIAESLQLKAQTNFKGLEHLFTTPKNYVVQHTNQVFKMDGNLQESDWQKAAWTRLLLKSF